MPTPKYDPETYHPQQSYSAKQLSRYDMQVAGVVEIRRELQAAAAARGQAGGYEGQHHEQGD